MEERSKGWEEEQGEREGKKYFFNFLFPSFTEK